VRNPELTILLEELKVIEESAHALLNNLTIESLNWQPEPGKWSIGECFDHLSVTGKELLPRMESALAEARREGTLAEGPFVYGRIGKWIVRSMEPPVRFKGRAPKFYKPAPQHSITKIQKDFFTVQDQLEALFRSADGLDLKHIKVPSQVIKIMKLPVGLWFQYILAHERRHLWQANNVKHHPNFPH